MNDDFPSWLTRTQSRRDFLDKYGSTGSGLGQNIDKAIEYAHEAEKIRDEAQEHLTHEKKLAMFKARQDYGDLTSREREVIEKDAVRDIQTIVNACETTLSSCVKRYFTYGRTK